MLDFMYVTHRCPKQGITEIYPKLLIKKSKDLMIRGGDFYAIWDENRGFWSEDEHDALRMIDEELDAYLNENKNKFDGSVHVLHMWDAGSGMIDRWHKYCQKQMRDNFHMLDEKLIFSNTKTTKEDYASKCLPYPLEAGDISSYEKLISTLYTEEERHKIEWAIGAIVSGDSRTIQKFLVLYGAAGTGKSTILNIVQKLFEGYYSVFDAKALGSSTNAFALEAFKNNPLVAIQHDGDLSRIEDNTRLNSLVSHELMTINEKFKSTYVSQFKCFLFMGTNKPVKITDAKSGLIRRLIDVQPSGNKLSRKEYNTAVKRIDFEIGAIAQHCLDVYLSDPGKYDDYIPTLMLGATNDFYDFVSDSYFVFKKDDGVTLKAAWEMYKTYCEDARVPYPLSRRIFKEELKNYFKNFEERSSLEDGVRVRNYYSGFITDKFEVVKPSKKDKQNKHLIDFGENPSMFDLTCSDCLAQYGSSKETPIKKWEDVKTTLADIDTSKLHYVKVPENHIVIDFDIPDENGNKCLEKNIEEASKWPPTYTELSKSGAGVHLHYIYTGDVSELSRVYDDKIEVKIFTGKSSLRRKLTKCNDLPIANISSGLPKKEKNKVVNMKTIKSERGLRTLIKRNLNKEIHPGTKPSIDFIYEILQQAYENENLNYDVSDMRNAVLTFAASSTNHAEYCIKLVNRMEFKSADPSLPSDNEDAELVFYDCEVFPNLFLVNWKVQGDNSPIVRMINPTPQEIEELMKFRLVGFNCRRYDNHILYARLMGYTNEQLYNLSQKIISGDREAFFGEAYNVSHTDVYDFASAGNKKSLKKFEIELGIHHQELGLPWDQPVPEEMWVKVAEYCDNDVIATEAVFNHLSADWTARQILAELTNSSVNDTTNTLATRFIFGSNRKPQDQFNYRDMGDMSDAVDDTPFTWESFDSKHRPLFSGYKYEFGKSTYRGEEVGEGGYVYAEPGIYTNVALLDIASMHPSSIIAEELFGPIYTKMFKDIVDTRLAIKHKEFDKARKMFDGRLAKYLTDESSAKDLANALKTVINSVYGLTSARFENPFHDPRNKDNIVAKRGALFMINLKHAVQEKGFKVAHIKTDSIKIPNATPDIIKFVTDYGKMYGYNFEHEATYDRMCLVNDAVYIAKYADDGHSFKLATNEKIETRWTATGAQFAVPYVFKKLFSKTDICFDDLHETKSVTSSMYLDMNEGFAPVDIYEKEWAERNKPVEKARLNPELSGMSNEEVIDRIASGHNYVFIGRVGSFCPVKSGCGGGLLMREKNGKYYAVTGTKGYRWLEAEMVKDLGKEDDIDRSYYDNLVNAAADAISEFGDLEWFVS